MTKVPRAKSVAGPVIYPAWVTWCTTLSKFKGKSRRFFSFSSVCGFQIQKTKRKQTETKHLSVRQKTLLSGSKHFREMKGPQQNREWWLSEFLQVMKINSETHGIRCEAKTRNKNLPSSTKMVTHIKELDSSLAASNIRFVGSISGWIPL